MRVLFLTNVPSPYRIDFFNELGKQCDLTVLFETQSAKSRNSEWISDKIENFKAVFMKGIRTGEAEAFCPEVIRYVRSKRYDIIVVGFYSSPTGMLAIEYMRLKKIPFILSSDGGIKKNDIGLKYKMKYHFIGAASAWLSTGKITTEYLEYYGAISNKVYTYPFTSISNKDVLTKPLTSKEKAIYRRKLNMKEDTIILSVGQFIHRKGYDILLKACNNLNDTIGIYIVGGKPTEEYLRLKKEFGLNNIYFIDFMKKEDLAKYYKAADFFVLPTREDIWGLVINEALAYGIPVITTDKCVAGVEMIGENEKIGKIINNSVEQLESELKNIENQEFSAQRILEVASMYTFEKMAEAHIECFRKEK
ncbi:MAG: glycosyltransferase family 4 protein [Intestinibacter bartlettii]|uniref:glycosyltransferase family 4 protein n=1 Tax=Intestinibacter bartlettii TaxID=261299 RepID=UPI00399FAD35